MQMNEAATGTEISITLPELAAAETLRYEHHYCALCILGSTK